MPRVDWMDCSLKPVSLSSGSQSSCTTTNTCLIMTQQDCLDFTADNRQQALQHEMTGMLA